MGKSKRNLRAKTSKPSSNETKILGKQGLSTEYMDTKVDQKSNITPSRGNEFNAVTSSISSKNNKGGRRGKLSKTSKETTTQTSGSVKSTVASFFSDAEFLLSLGQLSKEYPIGAKLNASNHTVAPGILSYSHTPLVGLTNQEQYNPIMQQAQQIYSFVRHANSGRANYDPVHLWSILYNVASIISIMQFVKRTILLTKAFSPRNKYMNKSLIEASHIRYDDLISNLAQYEARYNILVNRLKAFPLPTVYPIFLDLINSYKYVYKSLDSDKTSFTLLNPTIVFE